MKIKLLIISILFIAGCGINVPYMGVDPEPHALAYKSDDRALIVLVLPQNEQNSTAIFKNFMTEISRIFKGKEK